MITLTPEEKKELRELFRIVSESNTDEPQEEVDDLLIIDRFVGKKVKILSDIRAYHDFENLYKERIGKTYITNGKFFYNGDDYVLLTDNDKFGYSIDELKLVGKITNWRKALK